MAAKHYIIDAHNVMHKIPEVERLMAHGISAARTRFMSMLGDFAVSHRAYRFTVVFDGTAKDVKYSSSNVSVMRSGANKSADELIFDLIRKLHQGAATVVSSDNEIANFARASAQDVLPSVEFAEMISRGNSSAQESDEKPAFTRLHDLQELRRMFEGAPIESEKPNAAPGVSTPPIKRKGRPAKEKISDTEMLKRLKDKDFTETRTASTTKEEKPLFATKQEIDEWLRLFTGNE